MVRYASLIATLILSCLYWSIPLAAGPHTPRYISLAPSTTEILFALGLDKEIVGVSSSCDFPEEARDIETIGTFSQPNFEKIISLKPDIIFTTGLEQTPCVQRFKELGMRVVVSDPKDIPGLLDSIVEIGEATARENRAQALKGSITEAIRAFKEKIDALPARTRPRVFIEIWHDPLMTAGPGSFIDAMVNLAGAHNIAFDTPRAFCRFSAETVVARNPDIIILTYMTGKKPPDLLRARQGWGLINAVRNNKVFADIDPDLLLRPGPRIIKGLQELSRCFYHE